MIARCAKDIDYLIDSLPSEESSTELQVIAKQEQKAVCMCIDCNLIYFYLICYWLLFQLASLRRLEQENYDSSLKLKEVIGRGEALLERIQSALTDISQAQIEMQKLDNDPTVSGAVLNNSVLK